LGGRGSKGAIFFHCASVSNGRDRAIGPPPALLTLLIPHLKNPNHPHLNGLYPVMQQLLVASELEQRWNQALQRVSAIETRIAQHLEQTVDGPVPKPEEFAELVSQLERVWNDPNADVRLKKRILRTLIHEVVADVVSAGGEIILVIHWKGGVHTELRLPRRRRGQNSVQTPKSVVEAVTTLVRICSDDLIAGVLNRNGLKTGRGNRWTRERVTALRSHHGITCFSPEKQKVEGWMNLTEAAAFLGVSPRTIRLAVDRGEISAEHPLPDGPWIFQRP
jgi:hypothetical protein